MRKIIFILCILLFNFAFSQDITIYFTGKSFGKIEPCTCFKNPDGGIYRRITFFNKLKQDDPNAILLDTGNILTGGFGDEYNTVQDKSRNDLLLDAYNKINYDCIVPGLSELQRSPDALLKMVTANHLTFLSSNIKDTFQTVIIKKIGKVRILIIGISSNQCTNFTIDQGFKQRMINYRSAISAALKNYRHNDIVTLVGSISSEEAKKISMEFPKINIFIYGKNEILLSKPFKINHHIFAQSYFESKRVGKLTLTIKRGYIYKSKVDYIRMSPSIPANPVFFKKVKDIIGQEEMKKIYHVYIFLENTLAQEEIINVLKYLLKNKLKYAFVFKEITPNNAIYFQILNKNPQLFIKGNFDLNKNNIDIDSIKAENQLILKNFGPFKYKKCIYTGSRFIDFDKNTLTNLKEDLELLM